MQPEQLPLPGRSHRALVEDLHHQRRRAHQGHKDAPAIQAQVEGQLRQAAAELGGELRVPLGGGVRFIVRNSHA